MYTKSIWRKGLLSSAGAGSHYYDTFVGAIGFCVPLQNVTCINASAEHVVTTHRN